MQIHLSVLKMVLFSAILSPGIALGQNLQLPDDTTNEVFQPSLNNSYNAKSDEIADITISNIQLEQIRKVYGFVDPTNLISQKLKDAAFAYFHQNQSQFSNQNYVTIVDFSIHSSKARMYIIDMRTGDVTSLHVAHGKGSDLNNDGYADKFSNNSGSQMSSIGYYRVAETYLGNHGLSIRLDGLSASNSNVRARAIVIHGADYVSDRDITPGRSWGCFAIPMNDRNGVVKMLAGGSFMYANVAK